MAIAALPACGGGELREAGAPARPDKPTVAVSPRSGPPGTVFVMRGSGWRPRQPIEATYGPYCDERSCILLGLAKRFRTDWDGRFVFRFRDGPSARGLPKPAAAGSDLVTFEQWTGRPYRSRLARVRPRYSVRR